MTGQPPSGDGSPYGDDLRTLLTAHLAGYEPDRARIRARIDAGLADARRPGAGRAAWPWLRPPARVVALSAVSLVAAAAVLLAVVDIGRPVQVSTTGPAASPSAADDGGGGPRPSGDAADNSSAAPVTSAPGSGTDPTADGRFLVGTDVPGIRVPADDPEPTAPTGAAGTDGGAGSGTGVGTGGPSNGLSLSSVPQPGAGDGHLGASDAPVAATSSITAAPAEPTTRPPSTTTSPPTIVRPTNGPLVSGPAVQTGLLPKQVLLGPTGNLDWVVVGARNDGQAVRMKAGTGRLTVSAPSGAVTTPGLIPILWSGGSPEQDRTDNTRWWTANASSSSFVVQVAGADNPSEIALYAGSSTSLTVTVTVSGRSTTQKTVSPGYFGSAAKITVSLTGADRGRDVTVTLGAARGSVSLGAVTER